MSESALVIALVLSILPFIPSGVDGRFVLEVSGLPVAELRVSLTGERYVYESTHFLEEGPRERRVELRLSKEDPQPEVLALLRKPAPGCRDVLEERTRALEKLCVDRATGDDVGGTIAGEKFLAHYDRAGLLTQITVGAAHWFAANKPTAPPLESPFVRGVAVPEGTLQLDPPVQGTRWLARAPTGIGRSQSVGRVRCLLLAREEATRRPNARVVVGLVVEEGRAFPHAWLNEGGAAYDPSVLEGDPLLATRLYLEVPAEQSGSFFLRLFDGAVKLKAR